MKHILTAIVIALAVTQVAFERLIIPAADLLTALLEHHQSQASPPRPHLLPAPPAAIHLQRMSNAQLRQLAGTKRRLSKRQLISLIEQGRNTQALAA